MELHIASESCFSSTILSISQSNSNMTCGAGHNQSSSYLPFVLRRSYIPCRNIKNPQPQTAAKTFLVPPSEAPLGMTFNTLNLTVFDKGLHWPMTTLSPSFTRKAGETCADRLECRFSYLHKRQLKYWVDTIISHCKTTAWNLAYLSSDTTQPF
jgi:hypothetical protein